MALFFIGKPPQDFTPFLIGQGGYKFTEQLKFKAYFHNNEKEFLFCSEIPIISKNGKYSDYTFEQGNDLEKINEEAQNNYASFRLFKVENKTFLTIASSRFARAKIYFLKSAEGFYFSDDLRELLPYSNRQLSSSSIYSIIKYGNTPEYITIIEDIFSVPVASFLTIDIKNLHQRETLHFNDFKKYFKLQYEYEGSSLDTTKTLLGDIMDYHVDQNFAVPISGGIDSSLINYMMNERATDKYPAYNLSFGENDSELAFVKESVRNTKAELAIIKMLPKDFIPSFTFQAQNLIQPVGETSPVSMAHLFMNKQYNNHTILDGTLADGCYGSRNYNQPIISSKKTHSKRQLRMNELISSFLVVNNLPLKNRFFPRDSFVDDVFLQQIGIYVGPLSNTLFKNVDHLNKTLNGYWSDYHQVIESKLEKDYWMDYSIFKMINYASNTTIAKTFDLCGNNNNMSYPFMWRDVLIDQGKYTWEEKTKDNIIKYPLKKLIEKYASSEFIYRRKVGLNSSMENWFAFPANKKFLTDYLLQDNSVCKQMIGDRYTNKVIKTFNAGNAHRFVLQLVMSFAMIQAWCNENNINS